MPVNVDVSKVKAVGEILNDRTKPLAERFRALFTLRNLGGHTAVDCISTCFDDPSALLKHELAYCLGQMQDEYAIPVLTTVLKDMSQEPMVRHEAGEALGAIGQMDVIELLRQYSTDPFPEVAETCQLAVERIMWMNNQGSKKDNLLASPYASVDPAPPCAEQDVNVLRDILLDENATLFARYRAMFALRNCGTPEAAVALAEGLKCHKSALFRHEIAYVLGQMQQPAASTQLIESLRDTGENAMVRHECAEALGAISTDTCETALRQHLDDNVDVVRDSCVVALDMSEYEQAGQFEYADGLQRIDSKNIVPK